MSDVTDLEEVTWIMCGVHGPKCLVMGYRPAICAACEPMDRGGKGSGHRPTQRGAQGRAHGSQDPTGPASIAAPGRQRNSTDIEVHQRPQRSGEMARLTRSAKRSIQGKSKVPKKRLENVARLAAMRAGGLFIDGSQVAKLAQIVRQLPSLDGADVIMQAAEQHAGVDDQET